MSSSSKKKLRKEQAAAALTEKQRAQQQEAKKLKQMTTLFIVVLALVICAAVAVLSVRAYNNSGIKERNTISMTINEHELNTVDVGYFYYDTISKFYTSLIENYGNNAYTYAQLMYNIDLALPLDQQMQDEANNITWADYFIDQAIAGAKSAYTLYDEAIANGYELSAEDQAFLDSAIEELPTIAEDSGYRSLKAYLKGIYGNGASEESYLDYYTICTIANAYSTQYASSLKYSPEELREYEGDDSKQYNAYSYHTYYVSKADYLTGGTTDDEGNTTYSDAEQAAAVKAAEADAQLLVERAEISLRALQNAIAALEVNAEDEDATTSEYTNESYSYISSFIRDWVTDESREPGDATYIANTTELTNDDGSTTTQINGYYVIYFQECNDNTIPLANVRHILVNYEGGTTDENGTVTYSDDEKAAALAEAEAILAEWEAGEATEESFAALAAEKTDDESSAEDGGLYENVYPGQMVENFDAWCFDEDRKAGDTGIVTSDEYGCHVMFYCGDSETNYRDYMVSANKRSDDLAAWQANLIETATIVEGDISLLNTSLTFLY